MSRMPQPLFLSLICHAATPAGRRLVFGAEDGLDEQAARDTRRLASVIGTASATVASPARCTMETAAILSDETTTLAALREGDFGRWRGMSLPEVEAADPSGLAAWLTDATAAPHGGEPMRDVAARVAGWMDATPLASRIHAVTHPLVIRLAILHALGLPADDFRKVDVEFLSVTDLVRSQGRWSLRQRRLR